MKDAILREALDKMGLVEQGFDFYGNKRPLTQGNIKDSLARMQFGKLEKKHDMLIKYLNLELSTSTTKYVKIKKKG